MFWTPAGLVQLRSEGAGAAGAGGGVGESGPAHGQGNDSQYWPSPSGSRVSAARSAAAWFG
jgi:hypothetical protein